MTPHQQQVEVLLARRPALQTWTNNHRWLVESVELLLRIELERSIHVVQLSSLATPRPPTAPSEPSPDERQ